MYHFSALLFFKNMLEVIIIVYAYITLISYFKGEKVTSIVEFRAGPEHNGNIYQCFAHNPTFFDEESMQGEPNATIRLEVLCKFCPLCFILTLTN